MQWRSQQPTIKKSEDEQKEMYLTSKTSESDEKEYQTDKNFFGWMLISYKDA